ncbi:hypothetical protein LIER_41411 [Lithospermum erythrorhizon]|uniref:Uncharacterized protein n=1 Tax=Lithospermum erythrorhizon TaxID=34254 RepID=A0AAV3RA57_LITER
MLLKLVTSLVNVLSSRTTDINSFLISSLVKLLSACTTDVNSLPSFFFDMDYAMSQNSEVQTVIHFNDPCPDS